MKVDTFNLPVRLKITDIRYCRMLRIDLCDKERIS